MISIAISFFIFAAIAAFCCWADPVLYSATTPEERFEASLRARLENEVK